MLILGEDFEAQIIAVAALEGLNIEPGSLRIDTITEPVTTLRVTLVAEVDGATVKQIARRVLGG